MKKLWGLTIIIIFAWVGVAAGSGLNGPGGQPSNANLTAISGLTFADVSIIQLTGAGAGAVLTCTANQLIGANSAGTALECKDSLNASIKANDVDAHADISLTAAQVSRTFIHNLSQGAATATATLPAAAEGYTFIAFVSSQVAQDWVFDGNGAETIYTDIGGTLTAGRAGIKCNNQPVGSRMSCATFKTGAATWAWLCGAISGTWTAIAP